VTELRIAKWDEYQSYRKDRGQPPWIKVHRRLMRNLRWVDMTDAERGQLVAIWLLAADHDGAIPASPETIAKLCYMSDPPDVNKFIELGFIERQGDDKVASRRRQHDQPEAEAETEERREERKTLAHSAERAFESWWPLCWRKVGKKAAKREFIAILKRDEASEQELRDGAAATAAHYDAERTETQFMVHPVTWLKQGRWKDDLTVRRKPTAEEQLRNWVDGDEGDDIRGGTIDGECVEVPERELGGHRGGVLHGASEPERRGHHASDAGPAGDLAEGAPADTERHQDNRARLAALAQQCAQATRAGTNPRGDHAQDQMQDVSCPSDPRGSGGGEPPQALAPLDGGGVEGDQRASGGDEAGARHSRSVVNGIDLTLPGILDRRKAR